ncbi:MAG TPA: hypothetical protein VK179_00155 [Bacteroidales bacterium]|nr:hypothetical protein [Bacteroidales bacterium]
MLSSFKGSASAALLVVSILIPGCRHSKDNPIDLPDAQGIYSDIKYLDSLMQSPQTDSISTASLKIEALLGTYNNRNQTPDEQAILDSINRIYSLTSGFLRYCVDSRSNLELLKQDVSATEIQYKSGKIKAEYFINALVESEQTLVDINNRFDIDRSKVLDALRRFGQLQIMLTSQSAAQPF